MKLAGGGGLHLALDADQILFAGIGRTADAADMGYLVVSCLAPCRVGQWKVGEPI
jgi:hypothetical protein